MTATASAPPADAVVSGTTHFVTCPLCEATCGLQVELDASRQVSKVRGDRADVFSRGFICPKGASLGALENDPDRLRGPLVRRGGALQPASWEAALAEIDRRLPPIIAEHGPNAVGVYLGNPSVHNLALQLYMRVLLKALGTRNVFSASTVDQMPKQVAVGLMFGTMLSVPIPDIDRTDHLIVFGANPLASNGSLLTAPDMRGRLRALRARGGRLVVVDPRRTRTAAEADRHVPIHPGTDALLLAAMAHTLLGEDRVRLGELAPHVAGLEKLEPALERFTPEAVAGACGVDAATIRDLARELADAERAAVYGRIGTCAQEFGTLASWLVDVLNVLTGNLDRPGGAMFPLAAAAQANASGAPGTGRGVRFGRWRSRVRELPEVYGELPVACLAEEIDTPGDGQIRALITIAGNPALSTPNSDRLSAALERLDFMVSLDVYRNETTRHADVVLPGPTPLAHSHYDLAFNQLAIRNVAKYSPPAVAREPNVPEEWETLLRLTGIVAGQGPEADIDALDAFVAHTLTERELAGARAAGRPVAVDSAAAALVQVAGRRGPERLLDVLLRTGPYGDGFGARDGLTLAALEDAPHGIDLGELRPRIPEVLRTPSGKIELAPAELLADLPRLAAAARRRTDGGLVLIGRRHLRSNNSWMHNLEPLVRGPQTCTVRVHPEDAARHGLQDGALAAVSSRVGRIELPVELDDGIRPGVVSIPHGWGHDQPDTGLAVARRHAGANSNRLTDETLIDPLSGNAVLNGIPVQLTAATP